MTRRDVVVDACCALNLLATREERAIVSALDVRLLDTPQARGETLFIWSPPDEDGHRQRLPATTSALREAGLLTTRAVDAPPFVDAFVDAAARIADGDASCIALAGILEVPLLSDDRKERRIARDMFPSIELMSTLDVLHEASSRLAWDARRLSEVALALRWGGNFAPPRQDPRAEWYARLIGPR